MEVTYLYHSGFAADTGKHFIIFDYWKNTPAGGGLKDGVIDPKEIKDRDVIVLSSHRHKDHFNKVILDWPAVIPRCRIILSDDIKKTNGAITIGPDSELIQPDFALRTLRSNDEGVAFALNIDGLSIYHAGDLNWWHWEGEPGSWNDDIKQSYKKEVDRLKKETFDIAFIPVDPRLNEQYAWGMDYFMRTVNTRFAVPVHFGDDVSVLDRLFNDPVSKNYRDKIVPLKIRGQSFMID